MKGLPVREAKENRSSYPGAAGRWTLLEYQLSRLHRILTNDSLAAGICRPVGMGGGAWGDTLSQGFYGASMVKILA